MLLMPKPRKLVITGMATLAPEAAQALCRVAAGQAARRADAILTTSERMPAGFAGIGRHADRIRSAVHDRYHPVRRVPGDDRIAATRQRWGGRFAFACGRLIPAGYEVLIDAVAGTDLRVVIVGAARWRPAR